MATFSPDERAPVVVAGCRTPFLRHETGYRDLMSYDLGRMVLKCLMDRTSIEPSNIDQVVFGAVLNEPRTTNVARESMLGAGLPASIPAHTVTMACISGGQAITQAALSISIGAADAVIAGGTECLSNIPILLRRPLRRKLMGIKKLKGPLDYLMLLKGLRPADFLPEIPEVAEFSNALTMGQASDRMSACWGVSRREQDEYAVRSHHLAAVATENCLFGSVIDPVPAPPKFHIIEADNGIRADTSIEKLSALPPAFYKYFGTATAGNSSFLSDGAAAALIMSKKRAAELGLPPMARIVAYSFVGCDPTEELLLGPAYAIPVVLRGAGLDLSDIDVIELHEAFAGQVLCNIRALESEDFGRKLGYAGKVGQVRMERLNAMGGSLSIGHPFGATGIRLLLQCCARLSQEDGHFGLIASCAAGGLGHAMIIERTTK